MISIFKAKRGGMAVGTRRKWADGVYVKGADHHWHKAKADELSLDQLKSDGKHRRKKLVDDFREAVWSYVEHLNRLDLHPEDATPESDDRFWTKFFDDPDWDQDDSYYRLSQKVNHVVRRFHKHLTETGKKGGKNATVQFVNPLLQAEADRLIAMREDTFSHIQSYFDGKPILSKSDAKALVGYTIEVGGERGVVYSYYTYRFHRPDRPTQIPQLVMLTADGKKKVTNDAKAIKVLADPQAPTEQSSMVGEALQKIGIKSVVFDAKISATVQADWTLSLEKAFKELSKTLGLNLNGKVKILVYSSGGVKRSASADYSPLDKVIRLSLSKQRSSEALAHELGHALDDKLNDWRGTNGRAITDVVNAFLSSVDGKALLKRQEDTKIFGYPSQKRFLKYLLSSQEVFARCFETYIAHNCPLWEKEGWAKRAVSDEAFKTIRPVLEAMLKRPEIKKALEACL